jgi:hypothetical protein
MQSRRRRQRAGPKASAETRRADCSNPQGIANQKVPAIPAHAVAGKDRTHRMGCAIAAVARPGGAFR